MKENIIRKLILLISVSALTFGVVDHVDTSDLPKSEVKAYLDRNITDSLTIVVHHTAAPGTQKLKDIASYHVDTRGWPGIAYHLAIKPNGEIHFLNALEKRTYHNSADNTNTIGIVFLGNFETEQPTSEAMQAFTMLTEVICEELKIKGIKGHRDYKGTLCPGKNLYNSLNQLGILFP
ncbi:N-acetylmuramoyl-L-alanine amidase [Formosa undariae]|uniref:N-acetylmuramoyl-L-alanine amidase n=1 Tax=Formosa undariae TaxID=1325436 RepID=A0ABV5F6Q2_9FLAO